ncbi:ELOVL fatty acid elongase 8b [Rhincodon typus]|uniref:ELOVL fatty acid elongase 8b n=1 Tax=Rhincodon typus TaxID=259920 RepID=UPI00202E4294|nr:ELOVL fatty acid elongase 8b [Rhincodon typus]
MVFAVRRISLLPAWDPEPVPFRILSGAISTRECSLGADSCQDIQLYSIVNSMASTWEKIRDFYDWAVENGDKRTDPWFLVYSPIPIIVTFIVYLLICTYGPKYMRSREPFNLKYVLLVYNFSLVAISAYIFWEFLVTSIRANYSYLCEPVDYSNSELGLRMANVCWWFFFSKVIELMDTIFFILRKKYNQITFLHVYHHGTMIFNWWAGVKYVPGGQSFFIGLLNSFVHIVMYLYYGIAAMGPHMQKYLWWKRYLTMLQLVGLLYVCTVRFSVGFSLYK